MTVPSDFDPLTYPSTAAIPQGQVGRSDYWTEEDQENSDGAALLVAQLNRDRLIDAGWLDPTAAQALRAERDEARTAGKNAIDEAIKLAEAQLRVIDQRDALLPVAEAAKACAETLFRTTFIWPRQAGKTALAEVLQSLLAAVDEWQKAVTDG